MVDRHRPLGPQPARRSAAAARLSAAPEAASPGRVSSASRSSPTSTARIAAARSGFRRSPTSAGSARRSSGAACCSALVTRLYRFGLRRGRRSSSSRTPTTATCSSSRRIVRPDQARLLPGSGVDLDRFAPAPLPYGPPTFLLIARLLGDKGVREFVDAARIASAQNARRAVPAARPDRRGQSHGHRAAPSSTGGSREGVVDYLGDDRRRAAVHRGGERRRAAVLPRGPAAHRCSKPRRWPGR